MLLRAKFEKKGYMKFIGHLDTMRLFHRCFNRERIPILYSKGFNPHPKFSIPNPLPLGIESDCEYMEVELSEAISETIFLERMQRSLPEGIRIIKAQIFDDHESLFNFIEWSAYQLQIDNDAHYTEEEFLAAFCVFDRSEALLLNKKRKKKGQRVMEEVNVRPLIKKQEVETVSSRSIVLQAVLRSSNDGGLNALEYLRLLNRELSICQDLDVALICRTAQYLESAEGLKVPF